MYETSPYKIDGVGIRPPQIGQEQLYQKNRVSLSYNDIYANFIDYTIAIKDKFFWGYSYLRVSEMKVIEDIINAKQISGMKNNRFMITSWSARECAMVTKECYLNATQDYKILSSHNGVPTLVTVAYHWIEIKGQNPIDYDPGNLPPPA